MREVVEKGNFKQNTSHSAKAMRGTWKSRSRQFHEWQVEKYLLEIHITER
jgi:hypothetical protein